MGALSLLQGTGDTFSERVFLCARGVRHYVPAPERLAEYGLHWPDDLIRVPDQVIASLSMGGWLPSSFGKAADLEDIQSSLLMREYMASDLRGDGLEVGAGASPFPVPLHCQVRYGDRIHYEELVSHLYPGQSPVDLVRPDLITDFDDFDGVPDNSLDFIIGCHVIEHVLDPIGTIVNAHRKLKDGGSLLLVIPDKERTFDRDRPLTDLQHLIEDHFSPDHDRDRQHYEEFYRLAFPSPESEIESYVDRAVEAGFDCHFHVWNFQSFCELVDYINRDLVSWSSVWSHPTLPNEQEDIEFYFKLCK